MKVNEIMTTGVEKIQSHKTVAEAIDRMLELHITSLIVDKVGGEDAYGIITRKDIIKRIIVKNLDPRKTKIATVMSSPILTVHPDDDVVSIAKLMVRMDIRRFPVHDGHDLVGLVSNSDIFRAFAVQFHENKG